MLRINIIAVGRLKEKYLLDGVAEYLKRMHPYARVTITEVADEKEPPSFSSAALSLVVRKEGEKILKNISTDSFVIALAVDGQRMASETFANKISSLMTSGCSSIAFIIGGSNGLSDEVYARSDMRLSFSDFTLPHQLMRLVLVEQVYRACKIISGETYHK